MSEYELSVLRQRGLAARDSKARRGELRFALPPGYCWDELGRIEMYLVSTRAQRVTISRIGLTVPFAAGETIHTENSYKYSPGEMEEVATAARLHDQRVWQDVAGRFSLHLLTIRTDAADA